MPPISRHIAQPQACGLGSKRGRGRLIGRAKGGMSTKPQAITDANGRPLRFLMSAGQVSDYTGAAALVSDLPKTQWLLADQGYDADRFRDALRKKGIKPCIPGRKSRAKPIKYDRRRYKRRNFLDILNGAGGVADICHALAS